MAERAGRHPGIDADGYGIGRKSAPGYSFAGKDRSLETRAGGWQGDPATSMGRMLAILRRGKAVELRDLADDLWRSDSEGGPADSRGVLKQYLMRLRQRGWPIETVRYGVIYLDPRRVQTLLVGITVAVNYPGHGLHAQACFVTAEARRLKYQVPVTGERKIGAKGAAPVIDLGPQVAVRAIDRRRNPGTVFAMAPNELRVIPADWSEQDLIMPASPFDADDVSRETFHDDEGDE